MHTNGRRGEGFTTGLSRLRTDFAAITTCPEVPGYLDALAVFWSICEPAYVNVESDDPSGWTLTPDAIDLDSMRGNWCAFGEPPEEYLVPIPVEPFEPNQVDSILQKLATLEQANLVPFEPDGEADVERLVISLHLSAARALATMLLVHHDYSEDVEAALNNASRAWSKLSLQRPAGWSKTVPEAIRVSSAMVMAIVAIGLSSTAIRCSGHSDTILHAAKAAELLKWARQRMERRDYPEKFPLSSNEDDGNYRHVGNITSQAFHGTHPVPRWKLWVVSNQWFKARWTCVDFAQPEMIANAMIRLIEERQGDDKTDWKQLAKDCHSLHAVSFDPWNGAPQEDVIVGSPLLTPFRIDAFGKKWAWRDFWAHVEGQCKAQLTHSDLRIVRRELMEERKAERRTGWEEQSEERLRRYFFSSEESWTALPTKAQKALVTADTLWFNWKGYSREEAPLNELVVAVETVLYFLFWEPLRNNLSVSMRGQSEANKILTFLESFEERDNKVKAQQVPYPSMGDYLWLLKMGDLKSWINGMDKRARGPQRDWIPFFRDLSSTCRVLNTLRVPSQHNPITQDGPEENGAWEQVGKQIRIFLGAGQPGIVQQLAEWKRQLDMRD